MWQRNREWQACHARFATHIRGSHDSYCSSTSLPFGVFEAMQPRQKRQAEQILAQRPVRQHHGGDVAHRDVVDLDPVELDRCGAHRAVRGLTSVGDIRVAAGWMPSVAASSRGERDHRGAGVDHEAQAPAVDAGVDLKVAAAVARHDDRA